MVDKSTYFSGFHRVLAQRLKIEMQGFGARAQDDVHDLGIRFDDI